MNIHINTKTLGIIIVCIGIAIGIMVGLFKYNTAKLIDQEMQLSGGTCFENGICLHQQYAFNAPTYAGIILAAFTIGLGLYLIFFAKTQQTFLSVMTAAKEEAKQERGREDRFHIMLKALSPEERLVMEKVKEQDGITQTTLLLRTDLSKTKLSFVLSDLEKKGLIKKVKKGKINHIHLKEAF